MDSIYRAAITYFIVWLLFRISGQRTLAEITTFDAVLLLIISEATESALTNNDHSMTNSFLVIGTLILVDTGLSYIKQKAPIVGRIMDGQPLILFARGWLNEEAMQAERITKGDILHAAREKHGISKLDQVKYAILEDSGGVTIIPKSPD